MFWPNSEANIRPSGAQPRPCTLRCPRLHTGEPSSGLPGAGSPSAVMRRILPLRLSGSCADGGSPASPVVTYRKPSGPTASRPPSWLPAFAMPVRIGRSSPEDRPVERAAQDPVVVGRGGVQRQVDGRPGRRPAPPRRADRPRRRGPRRPRARRRPVRSRPSLVPSGPTRTSAAASRSVTTASPSGRNASPHGTSRSPTTSSVSDTSAVGAPVVPVVGRRPVVPARPGRAAGRERDDERARRDGPSSRGSSLIRPPQHGPRRPALGDHPEPAAARRLRDHPEPSPDLPLGPGSAALARA